MPCYDGREAEDNTRNYQLASVLCAVIRQYGIDHVIKCMDKECGVSETIVRKWWELHVKEDEARKKREREYKEQRKSNLLKDIKSLTEEFNTLFKTD